MRHNILATLFSAITRVYQFLYHWKREEPVLTFTENHSMFDFSHSFSVCILLSGDFEGGHGPPCEKSGPPVILYSTTYNVGQRY